MIDSFGAGPGARSCSSLSTRGMFVQAEGEDKDVVRASWRDSGTTLPGVCQDEVIGAWFS